MEKRLENLRGNVARILLLVVATGVIFLIFGVFFKSKVYADNRFKDIKLTDWYYEDVMAVANEDIIKGYPDETFRPESTVTYAEYITMVVKSYLGSDPGNSKEGHWASHYYDKGIENGLFTPYDVPKGSLDKEISREIMAVIMSNAVGGKEVEGYDLIRQSVSDIGNNNNEYSIIQSYGHGIITGYPNGEFKPTQTLTRGESATIIRRYIEPSRRKKPNIAKLKEKYDKGSYWKEDPEYAKLNDWIKHNTVPEWTDATRDEEKDPYLIANTSSNFKIENGKFVFMFDDGYGNYQELIPTNENYQDLHEHVYKTFKMYKEFVETHKDEDVYLHMGYDTSIGNMVRVGVKGDHASDTTIFEFSFADDHLYNKKLTQQDVFVSYTISKYSGFDFNRYYKDRDDFLNKKRIGHQDFYDVNENIFKMLYGKDTGIKLMEYSFEIWLNSFGTETRMKYGELHETIGGKYIYLNDLSSFTMDMDKP